MSTIKRNAVGEEPALVSHVKPGESLEMEDGDSKLVVSRSKSRRLTAEQIEADLQKLGSGDPELDVQSVLSDLRE